MLSSRFDSDFHIRVNKFIELSARKEDRRERALASNNQSIAVILNVALPPSLFGPVGVLMNLAEPTTKAELDSLIRYIGLFVMLAGYVNQ